MQVVIRAKASLVNGCGTSIRETAAEFGFPFIEALWVADFEPLQRRSGLADVAVLSPNRQF
jgi:hypothetical protein